MLQNTLAKFKHKLVDGAPINFLVLDFIVVQYPSHVQLFVITWTAARQASLSLII